jgi:hypothetical protein
MGFSAKNTPEGTRFTCAAVSKELPAPYEKDDGTMSKPCVDVVLRILEGEHQGEDLFWRGYLSEGKDGSSKNQEITMETLRNMGFSGDDLNSDEGLGSVKVHAVASHWEDRDGKTKLQWKVYPIRSKRAVLEPEAAKAFARQFKALAKSIPAIKVTDDNRVTEIPPPRASGNGKVAAADATDGSEF